MALTIKYRQTAVNAAGSNDPHRLAKTLSEEPFFKIGTLAVVQTDIQPKTENGSNSANFVQIQTENMRAAESTIQDLDISLEMTQFVCSHILSQSTVAMLSQGCALPGIALSLVSK